MAAPVFRVVGPSVAALKLPLVFVNVAVAVLLVRILTKEVGLRPAWPPWRRCFLRSPCQVPPASCFERTAARGTHPLRTVDLAGPGPAGVAGPRARHRLPASGIYHLRVRRAPASRAPEPFTAQAAVLLKHAVAIMAAVAAMTFVNVAKQFSSAAGPNTTIEQVLTPSTNLAELDARMCVDMATVPAGLKAVATSHWAWLFGLHAQPVVDFGVNASSIQGVPGLWVVMLMLLGLIAFRLVGAGRLWLQAPRANAPPTLFNGSSSRSI